jgi:uncharacterized protein YecT (DUF1311 family)
MRFALPLAAGLAVAASPAAAFDCGKARTASEKAICSDSTARAADEAMATVFSKRLAAESPVGKRTLVAAQARWLQDRDNHCSEPASRAGCLAKESADRRAFLAGEPLAGPGAPGQLAPSLRIEKVARGRADMNIQLLKYPSPATPAERAFNAAVDCLVGSLDEPAANDPGADRYAYERTMRLTYASPAFISAHLFGYDDTAGAHPNSFSGSVNIDVADGREAKFSDLLDAAGAKAVFALCLKQVVAQKKEREGADAPLGPDDMRELTKALNESTAKLDTWSFDAKGATVIYDAYAVGAYAEGAFTCEIPYAQLRPLARRTFPLP